SVIVPITIDGKAVLVSRKSNALGEEVATVISAANLNNTDPSAIALRAFHKFYITPRLGIQPELVGVVNPWKYLTSTTSCLLANLDIDSLEFVLTVGIKDPNITTHFSLSEEEFYEKIDSGEIH